MGSGILRTATGCLKVPVKVYSDHRGWFTELWRSSTPDLPPFAQDNLSESKAGVVRGMHFQRENPQGKFVRVLKGWVTDAVIDLRKNSETFGRMEAFQLIPDDFALYVPAGFAHGFWARQDSLFHYKCTTEYHAASDGGINPLDEKFVFPWAGLDVNLSPKDRELPKFDPAASYF